jgi:hypothetical protein
LTNEFKLQIFWVGDIFGWYLHSGF